MLTALAAPAGASVIAPGSRPPTVVTQAGGMRFAAKVRTHEVLVDQPIHAGGWDSAPTPLELLGAALGTCIAHYVAQFLGARHLPADGLRVEVEREPAEHGGIAAFKVCVQLPTRVTARQLVMLERVAHTCPVHRTLEAGVKIDVQVRQP